MFHNFLKLSRFIILIAVLGSFLAALASLIFGGIKTILVMVNIFQGALAETATKVVTVSFIEVIDLFLVGTIFYIVSLGLYELFIDDRLDLPPWLAIHSLDDLKSMLINGIVVILGVYFLGVLVAWDGQTDLIQIGASIALVIAALTLFQFVKSKQNGH
jgi:uncharacterized membrane protein YqhA